MMVGVDRRVVRRVAAHHHLIGGLLAHPSCHQLVAGFRRHQPSLS
jgi:hypothetical protein